MGCLPPLFQRVRLWVGASGVGAGSTHRVGTMPKRVQCYVQSITWCDKDDCHKWSKTSVLHHHDWTKSDAVPLREGDTYCTSPALCTNTLI